MSKNKLNNEEAYTQTIIDDLSNSPSCFHVIENQVNLLNKNNYKKLDENKKWNLKRGGKYYITRNNSSIIAFKIPKAKKINGFMICCSHSDHPCFKVINDSEAEVDGNYKVITVEHYPKTLYHTWIDVPLSVAGRVIVNSKNGISTKPVNVDRPLLMIPSLASHLSDDVNNKGVKFDTELHIRPILSTDTNTSLLEIVCAENNIDINTVIDSELFMYRYQKPLLWGANNEFMSACAIDDLTCAYSSVYALLESKTSNSIAMHVVFDNEEIGSITYQGATSSYLNNVLERIVGSIESGKVDYKTMLPNSLIMSSDNGHAIHPNYLEKYNKIIKTYMGKGAIIKKSATYAYSSNAESTAIIRNIAAKNGLSLQDYYNKPGDDAGRTLSSLVCPQNSIIGVDIGIAQLAMHSSYESCSAHDVYDLKEIIKATFSSSLYMNEDGEYTIK